MLVPLPPSVARLARTVRSYLGRVAGLRAAAITARAQRRPLWPDTVLYESFAGNGALCNPEAIFRELLARPEQQHLRHLWVLDATQGGRMRAEFAGDARVGFVRRRSAAYFVALSRARVLFNNATFPREFAKRPGQLYVNTWHGTPLKLMGYDMPDGALESANVLRNLLAADVLLAQNPFMAESMYRRAYKLDGLFRGRILEVGYPRVDHQFRPRDELLRIAARHGLRGLDGPDGHDAADGHDGHDAADARERPRLLVYAPTWTGTTFAAARNEARELLATTRELQRALGDSYLVRLKVHQSVHRFLAAEPDAAGVLVSNDCPTNVVLGLADALVTDFSSIFFDFLATGRRVFFFTPRAEQYEAERGTYVPLEELPGPVVASVPALATAILEAEPTTLRERREQWRREYTPDDDGRASARVVDAVFGNPTALRQPPASVERPRLLVYLGGLRSNGITSSALNLLAGLDHSRVDVSVLMTRPTGPVQAANQGRIDPRVRQFMRTGELNTSVARLVLLKLAERFRPGERDRLSSARDWEAEGRRLFGDAEFDSLVDFSGYSRFWSQLLLHLPARHRAIWLHNDMQAEVDRPTGDRRNMRRTLPAVFAVYPRFDALVSVSPALAQVNREALAELGLPPERFVHARNLIDAERIRAAAREPLDTLPEPFGTLAALRDPSLRCLVTVARLSHEKNHQRMLAAFAIVHAARPEARLLIVGDGPLRAELDAEVTRLGLDGVVTLTGALENPFPVMAAAGCFVLSSRYEGQPMVLLEAALLGLPIVTVRFDSVDDALPGASIRITEQSDEGLAAGMLDWLDGRVPPASLDAEAYNAEALAEFMAAVGL